MLAFSITLYSEATFKNTTSFIKPNIPSGKSRYKKWSPFVSRIFFTNRNLSFMLEDNDDLLLPRFVSRLPEQGDMMPMQPNMYQVEKLLGPEY
jgi:hypothetical protein